VAEELRPSPFVKSKWILPLLLIIFKLLCVFISPNGRNGEDLDSWRREVKNNMGNANLCP